MYSDPKTVRNMFHDQFRVQMRVYDRLLALMAQYDMKKAWRRRHFIHVTISTVYKHHGYIHLRALRKGNRD